jgi:hypothetical protein
MGKTNPLNDDDLAEFVLGDQRRADGDKPRVQRVSSRQRS